MFGKPDWFRTKKIGWGLRPVAWQGWCYALAWAAVICVPFVALLANHLLVQSLIWVIVMMFAMLWDVQQVIRGMQEPTAQQVDEDLLIINDDTEPEPNSFATRSYDLHVRR